VEQGGSGVRVNNINRARCARFYFICSLFKKPVKFKSCSYLKRCDMKKIVSVIGAVSQNGVYGEGEKIPWYIPEDFKHFKMLTTGNTVIMGKGTWESLPKKFRPLPGRDNFVITNTPGYVAEGSTIFASIEQAIDAAKTGKVFCIGGASIWYHAMHDADEAWITVVKQDYPVTKDTRIALDLLRPSDRWQAFSLKEVKRQEQVNDGVPSFEIRHWVKQ
jgi:dihydrofolate reductase